jgi:ADP-ribosyl-[dinitrogen reductase] hydrolase
VVADILPQRALGALVGSAVGDALGAPFEFGLAGQFTASFPTSARGTSNEMIGGGGFGWSPGEFTDDTQMALIMGEHLLTTGGLDEPTLFAAWQHWARDASDVGVQTRAVLAGGDWEHGARRHFEQTGRGAGNGALMRATTSALFAAAWPLGDSMRLAMRQAALTHGDPAAGAGAAILHAMVRVGVRGGDPMSALDEAFDHLPPDQATRYRALLGPDGTAEAPGNGSVWGCLVDAVMAVRQATSFEDAMRRACDVAGDVDTVACVAGAIAGARWGIQSIPSRWLTHVHGTVAGRTYRSLDLQSMAVRLLGGTAGAMVPDQAIKPVVEVRPGLFATNLLGALTVPADHAVISLCRVDERFHDRRHRREVFLIDQHDANDALAEVVDDVIAEIDAFRAVGVPVVVHCWAGESRTAFVLRAWLMADEELDAETAAAQIAAVWPHQVRRNLDFEDELVRRERAVEAPSE